MERELRAIYPGERMIVLAESRREWRAGLGALLLVCGAATASWLVLSAPQDGSDPTGSVVPAADAATLFAAESLAQPLDGVIHEGVVSSAAAELTTNDLVKVQTRLKALGFNPGKVDGIAGPRTLKALNAYRQSRGLKPADMVDRQAAAPLTP